MYSTASYSFSFETGSQHVGIVKRLQSIWRLPSCKIASHVHGVLTEAIHDYYMGMAWGKLVLGTYYLHCSRKRPFSPFKYHLNGKQKSVVLFRP
jgi:hypothetical protein